MQLCLRRKSLRSHHSIKTNHSIKQFHRTIIPSRQLLFRHKKLQIFASAINMCLNRVLQARLLHGSGSRAHLYGPGTCMLVEKRYNVAMLYLHLELGTNPLIALRGNIMLENYFEFGNIVSLKCNFVAGGSTLVAAIL